jgi:hypothetical protein
LHSFSRYTTPIFEAHSSRTKPDPARDQYFSRRSDCKLLCAIVVNNRGIFVCGDAASRSALRKLSREFWVWTGA